MPACREVKAQSNALNGIAEKYRYGQAPGGPLDIDHADELRPYEQTRLECRAFVEQLALRWPKPAYAAAAAANCAWYRSW